MAKGLYIGISSLARKIKKWYIGVNGVARKVKKAYIGVNGVARLFWSSGYSSLTYDGQATNLISKRSGIKAFGNSEYCIFSGGSSSNSPYTTGDTFTKNLVKGTIETLGNVEMRGAFTDKYGFIGGGYPNDPEGYIKSPVSTLLAFSTNLTKTTLAMTAQRYSFSMGTTTNNLIIFSGSKYRQSDTSPNEDYDAFNLNTLVKINTTMTTGRKSPGGGKLGSGKAIFHGGYYNSSDSLSSNGFIIDDNLVLTNIYPGVSKSYGGNTENGAFNGEYTIFSQSGLVFNSEGVKVSTLTLTAYYGTCSVEEGLSIFSGNSKFYVIDKNLVATDVTITDTGTYPQNTIGKVGDYILSASWSGANNYVFKGKLN